MKTLSIYGSIGAIAAVGAIAYAYGQQDLGTIAKRPAPIAQTRGMVGVYVTSVSRQISFADLQKAYPADQAGKVDPAKMRADAIVGWYDNGNNYHEQKMEANLGHIVGAERILPQMLKGTALRGQVARP